MVVLDIWRTSSGRLSRQQLLNRIEPDLCASLILLIVCSLAVYNCWKTIILLQSYIDMVIIPEVKAKLRFELTNITMQYRAACWNWWWFGFWLSGWFFCRLDDYLVDALGRLVCRVVDGFNNIWNDKLPEPINKLVVMMTDVFAVRISACNQKSD